MAIARNDRTRPDSTQTTGTSHRLPRTFLIALWDRTLGHTRKESLPDAPCRSGAAVASGRSVVRTEGHVGRDALVGRASDESCVATQPLVAAVLRPHPG